MSGRGRRAPGRTADPGPEPTAQGAAPPPAPELPRGRIPHVGMREIVAALHRRRERRRASAAELRHAMDRLAARVEHHLERIAELRQAVEAQGGDLSALEHYDNLMARLRSELRSAERALADAFHTAAAGGSPPRF